MTATTAFSGTQNSPWEQASFFMNGEQVSWNSPGIGLRRGQSNELIVKAPWLNGTKINLGLVNDNGLVIGAEPAFGDWVSVNDGEASWRLTPENLSGRVRLVFFTREFDQVHEFPCWVLSANLSDEGYATLGGTLLPIPVGPKEFLPGVSKHLNFRANPGSPIAGFPLMLNFTFKEPGLPDPLTSSPLILTKTTDHEWYLTGIVDTREIEFNLVITGQGMTPLTVSDCIRRSSNLLDYATIKLNGVDIPADGARFKGGVSETLSVVVKPGSPSLGWVVLSWQKGGGQLNGNYFKSDPAFTSPTGSMTWNITCPAQTRGEFALSIGTSLSHIRTSFRCFLEP
ncbi:Minor tail protein [Pseudomonas sp. IT-196MI5]|uniref:hypothetical protein n=1 Tax=unclassified Pseudomonas TaxID=196821 RepID=UPI0039E0A857